MRLEKIDKGLFGLVVSCSEPPDLGLIGRIASLIAASGDCKVKSILFNAPAFITDPSYLLVKEIIGRNSIIQISDCEGLEQKKDNLGNHVLCRHPDFICLRDCSNDKKYYMRTAADELAVDFTSRVACIISSLMGFPGFLSFGVRLTVYELLNNIVEYGIKNEKESWIRLELEKIEKKLTVSIADEGIEFDPMDREEFDLEDFIKSKNRRGLGLMLIKSMNRKMSYMREEGLNKIVIDKIVSQGIPIGRKGNMASLQISGPNAVKEGLFSVALKGELDSNGALILENLMNSLLDKQMYKVILDFEQVSFVSSAGVGMLLGLVSSLRHEGGEVYMANVSYKVMSVFDLLNLNDYFTFLDPVEMAE